MVVVIMIDGSVKRAKSVTSASNFKVHMLFKSAVTCLVLAVRLGVVVFVVFPPSLLITAQSRFK